MKKMKKLSALMLVLVLSLSFVACGGSKSITGTWTVDGTDADISKLELKDDKLTLTDSSQTQITFVKQ